ncbi:MAG: restriction endonuclease subunit S [Candidatus Omnitrophica bacterium]|nr:restriction endonuclease subunit S [Candidatus Omnitrophota bacterium]
MNSVEETKALTPWIGALPSDWRATRLDAVADVLFSNVDKHTLEGEEPVRLCNYVDVYKNERITGSLNFMEASAEPLEIEKFQIRRGDVLATKDSEEADDIAIPALVADDLPGVLCGYHLALIRPRFSTVSGPFLAWLHSSKSFRAQYEAKAVGVTRFGLSQYAFRAARVPIPPFPEQQRIAAYLDASCAAIDAAVAAKRHQLETLDALRRSTIKRAVTKGLNPSVSMLRTDVDWIPEMPQHWRLVRVKDAMDFFNTVRVPLSAAERGVMTKKTYDYYGASGVIDKVEAYLFDGTYILIAEDGANLLTRSKPLAFLATGQFWVNNHAHILKPRWGGDDTFFMNLLESQDFSLFVTGAAQPKLTMENLGRFKLAVPRVAEQKEIAAFIREKDAEFRPLFAQIERQIETLVAYRKSLIHECVTGQRRITEADLNQVKAHG